MLLSIYCPPAVIRIVSRDPILNCAMVSKCFTVLCGVVLDFKSIYADDGKTSRVETTSKTGTISRALSRK